MLTETVDLNQKKYYNKNIKQRRLILVSLLYGAIEVVIYNFFLLTIDTNINQFIKVYHIL
mgnify:CR=1 FL=1